MKVTVNGKVIGTITTNRSLTVQDVMYSLGYDITDPADCEKGYNDGVEGFYITDDGEYSFDYDAAETVY